MKSRRRKFSLEEGKKMYIGIFGTKAAYLCRRSRHFNKLLLRNTKTIVLKVSRFFKALGKYDEFPIDEVNILYGDSFIKNPYEGSFIKYLIRL